MAEAAHGTAPSLRGKNVANPMAMILAGAALLSYGDERAQQVGRAIREACLEAVVAGGPHGRPRRTCRHERVHRRGDQADAIEARGLGDALGLLRRLAAASASAPALQASRKALRDPWVELRAGAALDLGECARDRQRAPVRTRRRHGVERVRDREQTRLFGNLVAASDRSDSRRRPSARGGTARTAARRAQARPGSISLAPAAGCVRISASSCGLERTALAEERLRDHHLADVVQRRRRAPASGARSSSQPSHTATRAGERRSRARSAPPSRGHARRARRRGRPASARGHSRPRASFPAGCASARCR